MIAEMSKPAPILDVLGTHTVTVTVRNWLHLYPHCSMGGCLCQISLDGFTVRK